MKESDRETVPQGKCVSSCLLQAFIKARQERSSAAISRMVLPRDEY